MNKVMLPGLKLTELLLVRKMLNNYSEYFGKNSGIAKWWKILQCLPMQKKSVRDRQKSWKNNTKKSANA